MTKDTDFFGKMDPYVIVKCGSNHFKTVVDKNAGKTPRWNDSFTFDVNGETTIHFLVMDKDTFTKDDFLGEAFLSIDKIIYTGKFNEPLEITKQNKKTGSLHVEAVF